MRIGGRGREERMRMKECQMIDCCNAINPFILMFAEVLFTFIVS